MKDILKGEKAGQTMYILDTSTLKGIGKDKLASIVKNYDIAISPITVYELLRHLDENGQNKSFAQQKGNVLKCLITRLLHDPYAHHAISVGAEAITNKTHFEEPRMIKQLLSKLKDASSLKNFYTSEIIFPEGSRRKCSQLAERIRIIFEDEKQKYLEYLSKLKDIILKDFPQCPITGLSNSQLAEVIKKVLRTMISDYKSENQISKKFLEMKVFSSMSLHFGYQATRTADYIKIAKQSGCSFNPNLNDFEDGLILIHLEVFRKDALVTNDNGTITAIKKCLEAIQEILHGELSIECRVLSGEQFLRETFLN